jgi:Kelch motif
MAGTWQALTNQPAFNASTMLLLTDGTVMCQAYCSNNWWRLTPDASGSYVNGTWTQLSNSPNAPMYYASAVMSDGRVFVAGGEYDSCARADLLTAEIYDPVWNTWTSIPSPAGWTKIGDAASCVLPDGRILLGSIVGTKNAIYDPASNTWTAAASKAATSSEETWTLLGDETVLTVECYNSPHTEKYVIPADNWVTAGSTPSDIILESLNEIGPALLLPDGRVFAVGGNGRTALYSPPPVANQQGTWTMGPTFPNSWKSPDAPGVLLPNGNVLCEAGPDDGGWASPTHFFEFDGTNLTAVPDPPNNALRTYDTRLLLLPTGQVLYAARSNNMQVYTPSGAPDPAWKPVITSYPGNVRIAQSYTLHGRQLNGLSQACSYGDDCTNATNYPLVRLEGGGNVWYCRTFDHSTMGVATGFSIQSTNFTVPCGVPDGSYSLCVIANGIESDCVPITVGPFFERVPINEAMVNFLIGSLADGPLWVLTPHGPVPVDPWGPKIVDETRTAFRQIVSGIRTLRELGREVTKLQNAAAVQREVKQSVPSGSRRREELSQRKK